MPKTAIVIPCFNEAGRLKAENFLPFIRNNPDIGFCFVNDGSTDGTAELLRHLAGRFGDSVEVLELERNQGKAEAVRRGIMHVIERGIYGHVGYWDADLATPLGQIPEFLRIAATKPDVLIIMGSRIRRMGADITRYWYRHYAGRLFATFASFLLRIPVYDTQCGAKIIEAGLAKKIFAEPFAAMWLFDVEMLARAVNEVGPGRAADTIFEVPLDRWHDVTGSKLKVKHYFLAPFQLARIWLLYGK